MRGSLAHVQPTSPNGLRAAAVHTAESSAEHPALTADISTDTNFTSVSSMRAITALGTADSPPSLPGEHQQLVKELRHTIQQHRADRAAILRDHRGTTAQKAAERVTHFRTQLVKDLAELKTAAASIAANATPLLAARLEASLSQQPDQSKHGSSNTALKSWDTELTDRLAHAAQIVRTRLAILKDSNSVLQGADALEAALAKTEQRLGVWRRLDWYPLGEMAHSALVRRACNRLKAACTALGERLPSQDLTGLERSERLTLTSTRLAANSAALDTRIRAIASGVRRAPSLEARLMVADYLLSNHSTAGAGSAVLQQLKALRDGSLDKALARLEARNEISPLGAARIRESCTTVHTPKPKGRTRTEVESLKTRMESVHAELEGHVPEGDSRRQLSRQLEPGDATRLIREITHAVGETVCAALLHTRPSILGTAKRSPADFAAFVAELGRLNADFPDIVAQTVHGCPMRLCSIDGVRKLRADQVSNRETAEQIMQKKATLRELLGKAPPAQADLAFVVLSRGFYFSGKYAIGANRFPEDHIHTNTAHYSPGVKRGDVLQVLNLCAQAGLVSGNRGTWSLNPGHSFVKWILDNSSRLGQH